MTQPAPWATLADQRILITGGTGSFGHQFVRDCLNHSPRRIVVYSRDECKQHRMRQEFPDKRLEFWVGDVRDGPRLMRAMRAGFDVVVHAAALKQVPSCEYNPFEAVKTNILGAQNVIDAAIDTGVARVIALSTDKAVAPTNLYGATKLCAEKLFVQGNAYAGSGPTRFSCVRYGNVLGSRGSVVELWREQAKTGTVTITDPDMTRFWITLPQSVAFVVSALSVMRGGEVFVPDIPSCTMDELMRAVVPDAEWSEIGTRPGEKMHECLISQHERVHATYSDIGYTIWPEYHPWGPIPPITATSSKPVASNDPMRVATFQQIRAMIDDGE